MKLEIKTTNQPCLLNDCHVQHVVAYALVSFGRLILPTDRISDEAECLLLGVRIVQDFSMYDVVDISIAEKEVVVSLGS